MPEAARAARAKRQQHAEWGVAVCRLGDTEVAPELLAKLQRYINGELSLEELVRLDLPAGLSTLVYQVVAQREQYAG